MENAHSEDVGYVRTLVFSSASFVIIVVLQISFWWLHKCKRRPSVGVVKQDMLFAGWCWRFHGFSCLG